MNLFVLFGLFAILAAVWERRDIPRCVGFILAAVVFFILGGQIH